MGEVDRTNETLLEVLGKAFMSLTELQTVVTEVECIRNDRSLTYVSSAPADEQPLKPSHLLYGRTITSLTYPNERSKLTVDRRQTKQFCFYRRRLSSWWAKARAVLGVRPGSTL